MIDRCIIAGFGEKGNEKGKQSKTKRTLNEKKVCDIIWEKYRVVKTDGTYGYKRAD